MNVFWIMPEFRILGLQNPELLSLFQVEFLWTKYLVFYIEIQYSTINSDIFARVLFSRSRNEILAKWRNQFAVYR